MSFKPMQLTQLPHLGVLTLTGADALAFAQAQFMNDLRALAVGHWQWNGWLSAKGRVQALFPLLRTADQELLAIITGSPEAREALATALQRFVFRAKVRIGINPMWRVGGCFRDAAGSAAMDCARAVLSDATGEPGLLLAGQPWRELRLCREHVPLADDPDFVRRWRLADIAHGIPILEGDQLDAWTPHMLSLQRLPAFSVTKGCYPGQEIVARTHFLGHAKRTLAHVVSPVAMAAGAEIHSEGRVVGSVVCVERDDQGFAGLAVLPTALPADPTLAKRPVTIAPLAAITAACVFAE